MPIAQIEPDLDMHYRVNDFTDPWRKPEAVLMVHGTHFASEAVEWWIKFMGRTSLSSVLGFVNAINFTDISADIPKIQCPMLVITTEGSSLASVEQTRAWQEQVPGSELLVLPGNSYHIAVTNPERCAAAALDFIQRHEKP